MIVRPLICIPTYNNSGSIAEVLEEVFQASSLPILILDDGSEKPVSTLVKESSRVQIHRLEKNQGKGFAIQKCFELALAQSYTHIITMDGDGQHKAHDLKLIVEEILSHPWALIIGKRLFSGEHVPKSSQFGRKFSNFWVKYQTDQIVEDSQSGFRAYPLYFVQHSKFFTKKYDFEIEVLIRLIWKKVEVREVTIDVYYPPAHERVSHFDKKWDNVKISLLNTVLVILSLLHSNTSRKRMIISIWLGVFTGILPIFGFQMYLGAFLAFVFRLNFPLIFLAQQISLPPLIPLWTYVSLKIGSELTGETLHLTLDNAFGEAQRLLPVWILGSLILGVTLATIVGALAFFATGKNQAKKQWTGKDRGGKFGNWFMRTATKNFGPKLAYFFLCFICPYFYLFAPKAVKSHNQYFKITQPEMGFIKRQFKIVASFFKMGEILVDNFYSQNNGAEYFNLHKDGLENLDKALSKKRGYVSVGAHAGAWLLATKALGSDANAGEDLKVNVIEFNVGQGHNVSHKVVDSRVRYISNADEAPIFRINQALTQNELVIFMGDRIVSQNVELIPFFGKLAPIDVSSFKIAVAKRAPVSFSFAFKSATRDYSLFISDPIMPETFGAFGKNEAIIYLATKYAESMASHLKTYPTQWFNFFPFWSSISPMNVKNYSKESKSHLMQE